MKLIPALSAVMTKSLVMKNFSIVEKMQQRKEAEWASLKKYSESSIAKIPLSLGLSRNHRNRNFWYWAFSKAQFSSPTLTKKMSTLSSMPWKKKLHKMAKLWSKKAIRVIAFILLVGVSSTATRISMGKKSIWKPTKKVKLLANLLSCITLHELLQSSAKETKENCSLWTELPSVKLSNKLPWRKENSIRVSFLTWSCLRS